MAALACSRRGMISATFVSPVLVASGPVRSADLWDAALAEYIAARKAHEVFLAAVLDPAAKDAAGSYELLSSRVFPLEVKGDDLCAVRHDALQKLVGLRASDFDQRRVKFRLAYEEVLRFE